jgi:hypothetical protein
MGNSNSINPTQPKEASFGQILDFIATKYILTSNFQSLIQLYDKDYCDNLVVLTSDIIDKYFNDLEITYLSQRVKNGVEENIMEKDRMMFFTKDELNELNIKVPLKKKRVCRGIAKFYIKIAHVFAAIVTTINPVYIYKDADGNIVKKKLAEKHTIPKHVEKKLYKLGLCDMRINALKKGQVTEADKMNIVNPSICSINAGIENLAEEPGIPELEGLYYDKFDFQTGQFTGMTEETQVLYREDLERFFKTFTGLDVMPETIKKFSDIKLRDFENTESCLGKSAPLRQPAVNDPSIPIINNLFVQYANNVRQMLESTKKTQSDLLAVINILFTYVIDKATGQKVIRVNPKLTEDTLKEVVIRTRNIILQSYLKCETDFTTGIKIYQAILEKKVKDTAFKQVDVLEKTKEQLLNGGPVVAKPPKTAAETVETINEAEILSEDGEIQEVDALGEMKQSEPIVTKKPEQPVPNPEVPNLQVPNQQQTPVA